MQDLMDTEPVTVFMKCQCHFMHREGKKSIKNNI